MTGQRPKRLRRAASWSKLDDEARLDLSLHNVDGPAASYAVTVEEGETIGIGSEGLDRLRMRGVVPARRMQDGPGDAGQQASVASLSYSAARGLGCVCDWGCGGSAGAAAAADAGSTAGSATGSACPCAAAGTSPGSSVGPMKVPSSRAVRRPRSSITVKNDGTICAAYLDVKTNCGAYPNHPYSPTLEATAAVRMMPGPYKIRNYK